jgi:uncharacterized small protein (DUF1192 family)
LNAPLYRLVRALTIGRRLVSLGRKEDAMAETDDVDRPQPLPLHVLGQDLTGLSVDELEERIERLRNEIARLEDDLKGKRASRAAADSVFKS